ncbi:MAG: arginyltransferase [Pseudomonadota bacterium]
MKRILEPYANPIRFPEIVGSDMYGTIKLDFLHRGPTHQCYYLTDRAACEEGFKAKSFPPELYHDFMDNGFRRSGTVFYRSVCGACTQCRQLRVPVDEFLPTKSQRRVLRKNEDVDLRVKLPEFTQEKPVLYSRYLELKHNRVEEAPVDSLRRFLYRSPVITLEFEYRLRGTLIAVSIADICSRSLSSVYVYYDPDYFGRSPGSLSALRELKFCKDKNIPYYYLGFHVGDCPAMNYKSRFLPYEILDPVVGWVRHRAGRPA